MNRLGLQLSASTRAARRSAHRLPVWSRCLHTRKELSYPIEGGLGDFLPPATLKTIAVEYQQGLLDRLNDEVKSTEQENKSVVQTVIDTAADPNKVLAFNYSSEALNNSFFLECMKPPPADDMSHERNIDPVLGAQIRKDFGNLDQLKSNVGATALGMFSSGWVWLCTDPSGNLAVLPTFGAGTLLVRSREVDHPSAWSVVGEDLTPPAPEGFASSSPTPPLAPSSPASGVSHNFPPIHPQTPSRTFSTSASAFAALNITPKSIHNTTSSDTQMMGQKFNKTKEAGKKLFPLLALSVHEHAWISAGYGIWGKEEYVKRFWSVVDWSFVSAAYLKFLKRK